MIDHAKIFEISTKAEFESRALDIFRFQIEKNSVYNEFCGYLGKSRDNVTQIEEIPFLPIDFFKLRRIVSSSAPVDLVFSSSGTRGSIPSKHYVTDFYLYVQSFL